MSIKITQKTDYSSLLNSSSSNSSNNISSSILNLSQDYASIKNGSYGKLLKSYYSDSSSDWVKSNVNVEDTKKLSEVKSDAVDVKQKVSVINNKLIDGGDKNKLTTAVNEFADSYNSMIKSATDSGNSSITKQAKNLTNSAYVNSDLLKSAGITVNSDNTLSVDKEKLTNASAATLKTIFTNAGSFGDNVSSKASMLYNSANNALTSGGTYNSSAVATNTNNLGILFETYN